MALKAGQTRTKKLPDGTQVDVTLVGSPDEKTCYVLQSRETGNVARNKRGKILLFKTSDAAWDYGQSKGLLQSEWRPAHASNDAMHEGVKV